MLRTLLRGVALVPLFAALLSCGGGSEDDPERHEVPGLISISQPSQGSSTSSATVLVRGPRSNTVHTVTWSNSAGGKGSAALGSCGFFPSPLPLPCWEALIPLTIGANVITVIGDGSEGEFSQATISITRT